MQVNLKLCCQAVLGDRVLSRGQGGPGANLFYRSSRMLYSKRQNFLVYDAGFSNALGSEDYYTQS